MELGWAFEVTSWKTFISSDWRVSFCFWVMLWCDRVCFPDLGVLCVVLGISYHLKLCCGFRFVGGMQSILLELREGLGCGVLVDW